MKYTYRCGASGETFIVDTEANVYYDTNAPIFIALGVLVVVVIVFLVFLWGLIR